LILGLEFLHNNAVLHRDLRPANIYFDEKGYAKIGDFGMARMWRHLNSSDTSGTPGYMAPEVLLHEN
jgi:serine/threonine protein kinase